jgi:hypothetical protein
MLGSDSDCGRLRYVLVAFKRGRTCGTDNCRRGSCYSDWVQECGTLCSRSDGLVLDYRRVTHYNNSFCELTDYGINNAGSSDSRSYLGHYISQFSSSWNAAGLTVDVI